MGIPSIDEWLVADCSESGRWYVVHTQYPRFVIEMFELDDGICESGESEFFDECLDASLLARLARQAWLVFSGNVEESG